jgi:protocatechuate 3,4-dioxygenase beta subunit
MRFSTPYLAAVLLTILSLSASLCAQSTTKETAKVPRGSISGRVTIKDRGVPGVAIGVRTGGAYPSFEPFQKATTDQDGFYRIWNVAPGSYMITVAMPAFVAPEGRDGKYKTVLVGDGENVENINFALVRGGVITGRVTDADGRPVIEQQVNIYPAEYVESGKQHTVYAIGSIQTDDRGIYRVFGLPAGRYKVAVGRSDDDLNDSYGQPRNISYKQVFHPNASDRSKATIIEVREGSEAKDIDITLGRVVQTYSASGQLADENGQPVPNLRFGVQRIIGQAIEYTNNSAMANNRGEFILEGLVPGKYAAVLFANDNSGLRIDSFSFEVVDHDLTGLTVKVTRGSSVTGVIVFDNADKAVLTKLLQLQLRGIGVTTAYGATFGSSASSPLGPDGSFRLSGLPAGKVNFILASPGNPFPPKEFMVYKVERDGIFSPRGLEIKPGENLVGVRVYIAYTTATIRGVVNIENGSLSQVRTYVKISRTGEQLSNLRTLVLDERNHFLMDGLPAGSYEVIVFVNQPGSPPRNIKREVTVQNGETVELTINVDLSEPVKPGP